MKRLLAGLVLSAAVSGLSGCYIDPGYNYVRPNGQQGDAYYGHGVRSYDDGYYASPAYGGYYGSPGYGAYYGNGYAPGVSLGISGAWYGGSSWGGRRGYRDRYGYGGGYWRGQHSGTRVQRMDRDSPPDHNGRRNDRRAH